MRVKIAEEIRLDTEMRTKIEAEIRMKVEAEVKQEAANISQAESCRPGDCKSHPCQGRR